MMEYRKDIKHKPDSEYFWVVLGPITGFPDWHLQSQESRYPFPTAEAAERFAQVHRDMWPGRKVEVVDG